MSEKTEESKRKLPAKQTLSLDKGKEKIDDEDKLSQEAYSQAIKPTTDKEVIYPYIITATKSEIPIENRYASLKAYEIAEFYTRNMGIGLTAPKDFSYYQQILTETGSVIFDATRRGQEVAYSKFIIKKILLPEDWNTDMFSSRELKHAFPRQFNYMDYIQAWESALYYENRHRKFSWWIQFQLEGKIPQFPNWFIFWFQNWGLYPIIMPLKVRKIYEEFLKKNPSSKTPLLLFTSFYQIPWIARWEFFVSNRQGEKFGEKMGNYPMLSRRILTKWWDKYKFFENSIYQNERIKSFEKVDTKTLINQSSEARLKEMLETLAKSFSKEDLLKQIKALQGESSGEGQGDTDMINLQDSQDPFDQDDPFSFMS